MVTFGLGDWLAGILKPHIIYARQQGISLAVAAVFGVGMVLFLLLALFLGLTYVMPPFWAAMLCALICAVVAAVALLTVQRRAKLRQRAGADVVAIEEGKGGEAAGGTLLALRGVAAALLPAVLVAVIAYLMRRRRSD